MHTEASPRLSVARLVAAWFSFTRWTFSTCVAQMHDLAEGGADAVKDTIMDLGCEPAAAEPGPVGPLPPLEAAGFSAALRDEIEQTLARVAQVINGEPTGCWSPRTEEQVAALFAELAQAALARALDLRVEAAEAGLGSEQSSPGGWLHRYRRMLAEEGRWPPVPEGAAEQPSGEQAAARLGSSAPGG
jgi:hypothetical protein